MRTLFLHPPSFDGYDGGAGARYQMKREVRSFWYPTWLAQPAALIENSKLIDAPPHGTSLAEVVAEARNFDLAVLHAIQRSHLHMRTHPDPHAARNLSAPNPFAKPLGKHHAESLLRLNRLFSSRNTYRGAGSFCLGVGGVLEFVAP